MSGMGMKKQKPARNLWLVGLLLAALIALGIALSGTSVFQVLDPAGEIADKERRLLVITTLLGLLVIVPVFILTAVIAWRYRESNSKATYRPEWDRNLALEGLWWLIPCAIIVVLAGITWRSAHALDPTRQLVSATKPVHIQVVALDWRWLFLYPDEHIATLNYLEIPEKTPVTFDITADAPMNSFWIPRLGGQIYAMPGMSTQLHLNATKIGTYQGRSANISGKGFADMTFNTRVVSARAYADWLDHTQNSNRPAYLNYSTYLAIAKPSTDKQETSFSSVQSGLFSAIIMKGMGE